MDSTQKLVEKLVERRMQNTGEPQAVATANVLAAFEKLKKNENQPKAGQEIHRSVQVKRVERRSPKVGG